MERLDGQAGRVADEVQVLGDPGESGGVALLAAGAGTEGDNSVLIVVTAGSLHDQGAARVSL